MVTFPAQKRIFDCGKFFWMWKNIFLWKIFLIKEISLLLKKYFIIEISFAYGKIFACEKLLDQGNTFADKKFLWSRKYFCLWKISLIREKSWLLEKGKVLACRKISICVKVFWSRKRNRSKSSENERILVLKPIQYIFLNFVQKHNSLNFFQTKIYLALDKIIIIFVLVNTIVGPTL